MKKILSIVMLSLTGIGAGYSQSILNIDYDMGLPTGDFRNYIDKTGTRGLRVNQNWFIDDHVTLGGTFQWNGFGQKFDRNTYVLEDGAITSNNWNKLYSVPLLFNAFYHFVPEGKVRPYAGTGIGPYYIHQESQTGRYIQTEKNWKMGIAPEIGINLPFEPEGLGLNARLAYNLIFYNVAGMSNLSYLSFSIGASFYRH